MKTTPVNQRVRINILRFLGLSALVVILITMPRLDGFAYTSMQVSGIVLIATCILGRTWCTLFIGSRKNAELVTVGPYSVTRNPLYVFSTIGGFGVGFLTGSIVAALTAGAITLCVLYETAKRERDFLRNEFGPAYDEYSNRTPMFWPKLSQYREPAVWQFAPNRVRRIFSDGLIFLLAYPLISVAQYLQQEGYIATYIMLP